MWPNLDIFHKNSKSHILDAKLTLQPNFQLLLHSMEMLELLRLAYEIIICSRVGKEN